MHPQEEREIDRDSKKELQCNRTQVLNTQEGGRAGKAQIHPEPSPEKRIKEVELATEYLELTTLVGGLFEAEFPSIIFRKIWWI